MKKRCVKVAVIPSHIILILGLGLSVYGICLLKFFMVFDSIFFTNACFGAELMLNMTNIEQDFLVIS